MRSNRIAVAALLALALSAAVLVASAAARPAGVKTLTGVVGKNDAYKISLVDSKGKKVTKIAAGTYNLVIHDDSAIHNYELDGPHGKSWSFTKIPFTGTKTITLKLVAGKYKAYCEAHESVMFQHFTVT
jgi:plastocyanin